MHIGVCRTALTRNNQVSLKERPCVWPALEMTQIIDYRLESALTDLDILLSQLPYL